MVRINEVSMYMKATTGAAILSSEDTDRGIAVLYT